MAQKKTEQKLSPMRYIKNNKRRVSVLIVSLCLCMTIIYVANVLIMSTHATAKKIWVDNFEKMGHIVLSYETTGLQDKIEEYYETDDEAERAAFLADLRRQRLDIYNEICRKLEAVDGIKAAYPALMTDVYITPPIGKLNFNVPLVMPEETTTLMEHFKAKLCEGKMPEKAGELVLDTATKLNNHFKLGDKLKTYDGEERTDYTIVGFVDCDTYFGCGVRDEQKATFITVLTEKRIDDLSAAVETVLPAFNSKNDSCTDYKTNKSYFDKFISKEFESATKYIYIGIFVLLFISLFVVYTTYLRDRHNEWCLYCSIGYSRRSIYLSIMGELMFTFLLATVIGVIITAGMVIGLDAVMIKPIGIACEYIYPKTFVEILCAFVLLMGLLQLPIRYALYRIRTIDAMEDDLY